MFVTSYNEEFQWPKSTGWGRKTWPRDRTIKIEDNKNREPMYRNSETLTQLSKECLTPFNYLITPKPIVQTNPLLPFSMPELPKDDDSARSTRPRVFKAPEISLDDIEDLNTRQKIIDYTYSTTWGLESKEAGERITKRSVPNCAWELPYHVLFSREGVDEELCEKDMTDACLNEWDRSQSRALGDPTLAFWQHYKTSNPSKLIGESMFDAKSPMRSAEQILQLAREDKLRLPYKLRPVNYAGYMPSNPWEISPQKCQPNFADQMLTVNQLANRWREGVF